MNPMGPFRYETNATLERLGKRLRAARRAIVVSHSKPDGDALGSILAVVRACGAMGVASEGWLIGPVEASLLSLALPTRLEIVDPKRPTVPQDEPDLIVIVDTGAWSQLEPLADWLRERVDRAIGLDHHARGDHVAAERVVDVACGSCTALVARLIDRLGVDVTSGGDRHGWGSIAEALYLGLATDTGWFRLPNAKGPEFALAGRLLDAGVDKNRLYAVVEENHRPARLQIEARALTSLRFESAGRIAVSRLTLSDFAETGAGLEEISGLVNRPLEVGAVRASILLVESEPGLVKASFRSKPAPGEGDPGDFVDVNALAARFGGGGHVHAAGARLKGTLDQALEAILRALEQSEPPAR